MAPFVKPEKFILKFVWNLRGLCIAATILKKKQSHIFWFQNILQYYNNQKSMVWTYQQDIIENPEVSLYVYGKMNKERTLMGIA